MSEYDKTKLIFHEKYVWQYIRNQYIKRKAKYQIHLKRYINLERISWQGRVLLPIHIKTLHPMKNVNTIILNYPNNYGIWEKDYL